MKSFSVTVSALPGS